MNDLAIIILSAVPLGELRASIPVAISVYHFSAVRTVIDVFIGNALPVLPLVFGLNFVTKWCQKHWHFGSVILEKVFIRTRRRFEGDYQKYGAFALLVFVAIPFPLTGVWSGCVASVLFGIRPRYAIPAIIGGMMIAGFLVLAATKGVISLF